MDQRPEVKTGDPLAETVAFGADGSLGEDVLDARGEFSDGFPDEDDISSRTLGQYRMGPVIGRGTMGRVYQAEHMGLHRVCAIKVMNPGLVARQPQVAERFWAEARAVANLVHPNIVTVHNLGSDRGYHYIEMEFVPGGVTLKDELVRQGAFNALRAASLTREVVLALGAAHRAGLVHRDVKPSNVLVTAETRAKLADFGLVRRLGELSHVGALVAGTPTYMAPELFRGVPASPRSDFYAVGVMLFYLLSARLPFASDRIRTLAAMHVQAPVPDVRLLAPETPEALVEILGRCLAKKSSDRPESAEVLAADLKAAIAMLRDTDALIREGLEGLDCFVQGANERYRLVFPLPGDRIQEVYIESTLGRHAERLLTLFSVCAPAQPEHHEFILRLNAELTHGALSIRVVNGQPMYVMTRTFHRDHVSAADIRAALGEIARRGDLVEQELTSADLY